MIKEHIKLRFASETDLNAVKMVAEKQGYTLEQLVHVLLHREVLGYLDARKELNGRTSDEPKTDKV